MTTAAAVKCFYFAHFHSVLQYGIVLWGGSASVDRVFVLQKAAVRLMAGVTYREHCRPLFTKLQILTLPCVLILECLLYIKNNGIHFITQAQQHAHDTRHNNYIVLPIHRLERTKSQPLFYLAVKLYNKLPILVKQMSPIQYKSKIKRYLLENAFYTVQEYLDCDKQM